MANVGDVRTRAELFHDALAEGTLPGVLRYRGQAIGDASPAAIEIFLNAEEDSRFYLPSDSHVVVQIIASAWNVSDADVPTGAVMFAMVENDSGTVGAVPTNLRATDGNPITEYVGESGGTFAIVADNTNKALRLNFTPTANDTYEVAATMLYSFSSTDLRGPNFFTATN